MRKERAKAKGGIKDHFAGVNDELLLELANSRDPNDLTKGALARHEAIAELVRRGQLSAFEPAPAGKAALQRPTAKPYSQGNPKEMKKSDPDRWKLRVVCMADVKRKETDWLWPNRFPLGLMSMIVGDPGSGKSSLALSIAATVTTGGCWPDHPGEPTPKGSVLYLQSEMTPDTTIAKRLEESGADVSKVHIVMGLEDTIDGEERGFSLARDMRKLESLIQSIGDVRLVIIDPMGSYLNGVDENRMGDVKALIDPLRPFAEKHKVAVLIVAHLNKSSSTNVLSRIAGSLAFGATARMIWFVSFYPGDRERRVLSYVKGNEADDIPPGMSYRYAGGRHAWDEHPVNWVADDVAFLLAERLMNGKDARDKWNAERGPVPVKKEEAFEVILKILGKGPCPLSSAADQALNLGIQDSTFRRTLKGLLKKGKVRKEMREVEAMPDGSRPKRRKQLWLLLAEAEATPPGAGESSANP
ncbi:AAA family ATPase [Singulisphaera sp. PoT]|uniref:AAA family ATPase n=1 Tax=Singulisphaera sp. PoT TaxID=3411797 RepID=UPI003BF51DCF